MEQQTNKKTKQTNKGLSSLSKLVKIDLYQICLEQKRRKEVQTMSRLKCTLAGKCGWHIPSLPLITLLVCTSLHHICPSQIWCIFFSFNARYFQNTHVREKDILKVMEQPNSESGFFFVPWSLPVPDSEKVKYRDRDNCSPLPEQASLIFARLVFVTSKTI